MARNGFISRLDEVTSQGRSPTLLYAIIYDETRNAKPIIIVGYILTSKKPKYECVVTVPQHATHLTWKCNHFGSSRVLPYSPVAISAVFVYVQET